MLQPSAMIEIHYQLTEVYGESYMGVKGVRKCCRRFTTGRTEIHDGKRSGRPSISVETTMRADRRITLDDLCDSVPQISRSTIHRILTEKLKYRKVWARWLPRIEQQRVDSSREFFHRYPNEEDNLLDSIVTGDKTMGFCMTSL